MSAENHSMNEDCKTGQGSERCDDCPSAEFRIYNGATGTLACIHCGQIKQLATHSTLTALGGGDAQARIAKMEELLRDLREDMENINRDDDGDDYMNISAGAITAIDAALTPITGKE